ncbi:MAG TPA: methyltransferase domain-containing protein [Ktedonobacteraceae bacterium]|nr:methyltransferase domain-containing protein [Ktedonobacteraceae bacterium]
MQDTPQEENTYVFDAESAAEMARLIAQDLLVTKYMGGLLPENPAFIGIKRVLDVACGPGGWTIEVAFAHPDVEVVGIDISHTMIEYARTQAKVQGLSNARFLVMDATRPLDFPDDYFDLVNLRGAVGFMSPTAWPNFVREAVRISHSGGMIRLTECDDMGTTSSPAFEKLSAMGSAAFLRAGRSFSPEGRNWGLTPMLARFLREAGCKNIQQRAHVIDYSAGTEAHDGMFHNWMISLKFTQPFLVRMGSATQEELDNLYQQALAEMMADDFSALWYFLTVTGEKP